jgi:DNA repair protein RadC
MGREAWIGRGRVLRGSADALDLFAPDFSGLVTEELRIAHLDADCRLLAVSAQTGGGTDAIDLPIGDIVRKAIAVGARGLVLAHNHPSGDPTPSRADKTATRRLADAVRRLDIRLIDHLIFADRGCSSFRQLGLL